MGSLLMDRIFRSTPNGILTAHSEWLPGVWLRHSVPLVQYIQRMVRVGGCPVVVTQWQSTGPTSQVSWVQFPMTVSLFTSSIFASKTSNLSLCPSSLSLFPKLLLLYTQTCNVLCGKILQHDWTALYSAMGHGFSSPDPSLSCGSGSGLRD